MSKVAQDNLSSIEEMKRAAEQSAGASQQIVGAAEQMRSQAMRQHQITADLKTVIDGSTSSPSSHGEHTHPNQAKPRRVLGSQQPSTLHQGQPPAESNYDEHFSDY